MNTNTSRTERYAFADLHQLVGHLDLLTLAERTGYSPRTLHRWQQHDIPERSADRIAIALGYHPANIWPTQWNTH